MPGEENNDAINSGTSLSFVCIQRSVSLIQTSHSTVTHNFPIRCCADADLAPLFVSSLSRPPWFDLPPPPYLSEEGPPSEDELPQYEELQDPTGQHTAASTARTVASGGQVSMSSREDLDQLQLQD